MKSGIHFSNFFVAKEMQNAGVRRPLGRQVSNHSAMSSISPKARGDRSMRSQMRGSFPAASIALGSPSEEPLRGEVYKDLHERYLDLHKRVSQSKCELQRLRKEFASKAGDGRIMQQLQSEIEIDKKRSLQLVEALNKIMEEIPNESRERKAAIMRKNLHVISEWNPRIHSLLRFVESQVTMTIPTKKPWAP